MQTSAYSAFKGEAERITNLAVLFSHAVPVLTRVIKDPAAAASVALKPADNFPHDNSDGPTLLQFAMGYDQALARLIVLSVFSYFEAYVSAALGEVFDLQGGLENFKRIAARRATKHWTLPPGPIAEAKRRLQTRDDRAKIDRFKKFSNVLDEARFAFPPDLLAQYGAQQLAKKIEPKGRQALRAHEIPDLLADALLCPPTPAERHVFEDIRSLRNKVAHGAAPALTVHSAIKKSTSLRKWAGRIEAHIAEHFLVLAKYSK